MSLKEDLKTENVTYLDLSRFSQVASGSPVRAVVDQMRANKSNVCLITYGEQLKGIFTSRDLVRRVMTKPELLDAVIDEVMTSDPLTVPPDTAAAAAFWLMDDKGFRDLPVVDENGAIVGNMNHRSIMNYLAARYPSLIINLPPRPDHFPHQAEGG